MPTAPTTSPRLTRRALVGLGLGGAAVVATGCSAVQDITDDVLGRGEEPPPGAVNASEPATDADAELADEVGAMIAATAAFVAAVGLAAPAVAEVSARFGAVHAAHLDELGYEDEPVTEAVRANRRNGLRKILGAELELQGQLVEAAQGARSGALAQVLASMAGSLAQHRAVTA